MLPDSYRAGVEGAFAHFGVKTAFSEQVLHKFLNGKKHLLKGKDSDNHSINKLKDFIQKLSG